MTSAVYAVFGRFQRECASDPSRFETHPGALISPEDFRRFWAARPLGFFLVQQRETFVTGSGADTELISRALAFNYISFSVDASKRIISYIDNIIDNIIGMCHH